MNVGTPVLKERGWGDLGDSQRQARKLKSVQVKRTERFQKTEVGAPDDRKWPWGQT